METSTKDNPRLSDAVRTITAAFALAAAFGIMTTAVTQAADRGHDDRGRHDQHRGGDHRGYAYEHPGNYYAAPPPVYYQSAPPPPAIDFVFPLNIR
jgi:hypothetical protein